MVFQSQKKILWNWKIKNRKIEKKKIKKEIEKLFNKPNIMPKDDLDKFEE